MGRAKLLLRIGGAAIAAFGLVCLPVGYGVNPKRGLSVFNNLADTGIFVTAGLVLIATGAVLLWLHGYCLARSPTTFSERLLRERGVA
jgi:hypothetical protein